MIFLEPKRLYNGPFDGRHERELTTWAGNAAAEVPDGHYTVPLGKAAVVREGEDATILAYGTMVHVSLAAIEEAGIDAEIIDLRSIVPLDIETIVASVTKTGRCVIVHEASRFGGFGGELSALVQERCFYHLEAPIERVGGWDTPYPHAFEWDYFPGPARVAAALRAGYGEQLMGGFQFKLPDIGEGIAEAEIVAWHVKVGDRVGEDQPLADMMTDKATVEIESPVAGVVKSLAGEVGDKVAIGGVLVEFEAEGGGAEPEPAVAEPAAPLPPPLRGGAGGGGRPAGAARDRRPPPPTPPLKGRGSRRPHPPNPAKPAASSPRPQCARGPRTSASISRKSKPTASTSATPTSMRSCATARRKATRRRTPRVPGPTRPSRSSACAAASPRTWPRPSAIFRTSRMSTRST